MKTKESKQKNLLIGGLLAIVLIMAVGYAAFATQLNITGTASFDNTWCIGFDSRNTSAYQATAGVSGGTVPTGSISFDGNTCATNYKTDASLNANFKQPGDKIVYTLTIANKSTLTAAIKSIKVEDQNVTSNKTITKGNVKYTVEMPESTTLAANATTTMKVTAEFQNDTDINKYTTGETQTLDVEINAQQDDGNGGMDITPATQTVYAWNTTAITVGTSTINDLASTKTAQPYYTSASDVMSASGYTLFNKYTVVNDTITEGYSCQTFGIAGFEPVCLKMSTDGSGYGYDAGGNHTGNAGILKTLQSNSTFTGNSPAGSCSFTSGRSSGDAGTLAVDANLYGNVSAGDYSTGAYCRVSSDGSANCYG